MKRLKLFPKIFLYTLGIMLFVVTVTHGLIYLLAPRMQLAMSTQDDVVISIRQEEFVTEAVEKALPISLSCSLLISVICSLLFSKAIADPIKKISVSTERMMKLDHGASCPIYTKDEIGTLAQNVNDLYSNLLSTIEQLEQEKDAVRDMERAKVDFLRAASHELKTPVTALNATLENMILGVGKYQDYATYLPECKEMVEQLSHMIHEILETSKLNATDEALKAVDVSDLLTELCESYQMIAAAHQISFSLDVPEQFPASLPVSSFQKAVSNVLANAVAYTGAGKSVSVYMDGRSLVIENECDPIPTDEIRRLFEPFYRPDFSRSRESGGNGLGLYIVDTLLTAIDLCDDDTLKLAMHLSFACSLRQGELLGLTWDCMDISPESIKSGKAFVYIDKELQRVSRDALSQTEEHGVKLKFPSILGCRHTVLVLKEPKTKTSVRKVFLPRAVAEMLVERKKEIDELKELLGDEYTDYNLVFASTSGTPIEGSTISRLFNKLISDNGLPRVVFHSIRHTSTTYKLMLSGGDIKGVQGDTGHAQASMVTERYAHILDDNRRVNAERFQQQFYSSSVSEEPAKQPDPIQELDAGGKQALLLKLLTESPEMASMIKSLAQAI